MTSPELSSLAPPRRSTRARDAAPVAGSTVAAPRIYDLYPLRVGTIVDWIERLPHAAAMGFDWAYVNSFHAAGASGSLYATADFDRVDPRFLPAGATAGDVLLEKFTAAARRRGLRAMTDLTIGYAAADTTLLAAHGDWFRRRRDGELDHPSAPDSGVVWRDLASFAYDDPGARAALVEFWTQHIRRMLALGFRGFMCKAPYLAPREVWRGLISGARAECVDVMFVADCAGARDDQVDKLGGLGFDYLTSNAKWWDFRAGWFPEQATRRRRIAPSIAFPETHDTDRIAAAAPDPTRTAEWLALHVLFAASVAAGWMMPVGVEYGSRVRLDAGRNESDPEAVDLTAIIATINAARRRSPAFAEEGALIRVAGAGAGVAALVRLSAGHLAGADHGVAIALNPDPQHAHILDVGAVLAELGGQFRVADITPARDPLDLESAATVTLSPLEIRILEGTRPARRPAGKSREPELFARERIAIERISPEIDGGRFPAKRVAGDVVTVEADIFADGHDRLAAHVKYREHGATIWREAPMEPFDNDRWRGRFAVTHNTLYRYTIEAWRDRFASWRADFIKKRDAKQAGETDLGEGLALARGALKSADDPDAKRLYELLNDPAPGAPERALLSDELAAAMRRHGERANLTRYSTELPLVVDRKAARCSAWYELFPRSQSNQPGVQGSFDDVIARLPYVQKLGFDVLYFPPIHPIGHTNRKGRNNSLTAGPGDPGSPYAIGAETGGHTAVHPELGTIEDFRRLVAAAHDHGLEIALDFAVQCSLDHPWIKEHPAWFDWRADGTIKYAENPPKKYEDIVNPNFYGPGLPSLWLALRDVVRFWIGEGVRIFRVDNPHTKPLPFWEWMIADIHADYPDVIFLSEAFTRPKLMKRLAKAGFSQSYTYFTWRNTKTELTAYLEELIGATGEYMRPNFFVNTPDINPFVLRDGGRPAFMSRVVLAATLSSAYGIYSGYEFCDSAYLPGREEYADSEKYEIKTRDWNAPGIGDLIARLNRIRRDNAALHDFRNLRFCPAADGNVIVYAKMTAARDNVLVVAVNLDPHNTRASSFEVPFWEMGLPDHATVRAHELLTDSVDVWSGKWRNVVLDPQFNPAAIWRLTATGVAA